ncbi:MAG: DUF5916 domain-containing protein [Bacteroidota bacterium]
MKKTTFTILLAFLFVTVHASPSITKKYHAQRITSAPRIDGRVDDDCWKDALIASDFITNTPQYGNAASLPTEVKMAFDNNAVYILAHLYDSVPRKMLTPLTERDNLKDVETFFFGFDTYNDDLNAYRFEVSIKNVQGDGKFSPSNLDYSWDAVWESAVSLTNDGWIAEVRIPYSALRFPDRDVQNWGVQFGRIIARMGELNTWSPIDPDIRGAVGQWGDLEGVSSIHPPLRLSFSPYLSSTWQQNPTDEGYSNSKSINGGLDLKYGINESFTLDMTLIPDFGQIQSDKEVLNLSAFETQYDEKRPFFTEGTELFHPGDPQFRDGELFYSRRIGGLPRGYYSVYSQMNDDEEIIDNPAETQLFNATKITGRTNGGTGIGFFNAITAPVFARVKQKESGEERDIETSPLTNYNVIVIDQSLKNNSKVTFLNASTIREGENTDGNVSSVNYDLRFHKNTYALSGFANYSYRHNKNFVDDPMTGYYYNFIVQKVSGKFKFDVFNSAISNNYNQGDLGYQRARNEMSNFAGVTYSINKTKKGPFLNWNSYLSGNYTSRLEPFTYQDIDINAGANVQFRNLWYAGIYMNGKPGWYYDFYEPRVEGAKYYRVGYQFAGIYVNTDSRKKVYVNASIEYGESPVPSDPYKGVSFEINYKATDRLLFAYGTNVSRDESNFGWVADNGTPESVIFGRRDVTTVSNELFMKYAFTSRMNVSFRGRHYWSKAEYFDYYTLNSNGTLTLTDYDGNGDISYNQFNIDMIFNWEFAPGSFITAAWKNDISQFDQLSHHDYFNNVDKTYDAPKANKLSIKIIYYLDYLSLKKHAA